MAMAPVTDTPSETLSDEEFPDASQNQLGGTMGASSDSEDDIPQNNGYELLSQDPEYEAENSEDVDEDSEIGVEGDQQENFEADHLAAVPLSVETQAFYEESLQVSERERIREQAAVWKTNSRPNDNQVMDQEKVEQIKAAMAGFSLPSSAVPSWASQVPEEEWKSQLFAKIRKLDQDDCTVKNQ